MIVLTAKPSSNFQRKLGFVASSTSWLLCLLFLFHLWIEVERGWLKKVVAWFPPTPIDCCLFISNFFSSVSERPPPVDCCVFSSLSIFDPVDCYVPSSFHHLDYQSNRGGKRLIVAFTRNLSSHLAKSTSYLIWSSSALCFRRGCFVDPSIISTAAASTDAKGMCFGINWTTTSRGREVESEEITIN